MSVIRKLPPFDAEDTFVIGGRGRVFVGRFSATPQVTDHEMLGLYVLIRPRAANSHLKAILPEERTFRITGVERFRLLINQGALRDGENVGLMVADDRL